MADQGGFGLDFQITVTATLTSVTNVVDVKFPAPENVLAEKTAHDSAGGFQEFIASGKKTVSEIELELIWDVAEATHSELVTLEASGAENAMTIADPGAAETLAFNGIVKQIERMGEQEEAYKAKVVIQPTGQITIS